MSATVFITYPGNSSDRFDRDYWLNDHFQLVRDIWGPLGMISVAGFFPEGDDGGTIAIAPVVFKDEAAMKGAFQAPASKQVFDDVKNYTDIKPVQLIGKPVD